MSIEKANNNSSMPPKPRELRIVGVSHIKSFIKGLTFNVPSYQRGYRWERRQVRQLLADIMINHQSWSYYLQPIVVAHRGKIGDNEVYDLIDGQQRMTTLYLIYHALQQLIVDRKKAAEGSPQLKVILNNLMFDKKFDIVPGYDVIYETRSDSADFLKNIHEKSVEEASVYPDFLYMWHAYHEITDWLNGSSGNDRYQDRATRIADALQNEVKIIWYEIASDVNSWKKFADLNVGKIPLTNSELIKALFLRSDQDNGIKEYEKDIIVDQWDSIERSLADPEFWAFLTNRKQSDFQTRIDLIFNIISGKTDINDPFGTFHYFNEKFENQKKIGSWKGKATWDDIYAQYHLLHDWFKDRSLYHRIGFLNTFPDKGETNILHTLITLCKNMSHEEFSAELDKRIKNKIKLGEDGSIRGLNYNNNKPEILKVLTLFNVLTMNRMKDPSARYSFNHHKNIKGGWSLEHIHAQNSEELTHKDQWILWIELHKESLNRFKLLSKALDATPEELTKIDGLKDEMNKFLEQPELMSQAKFNEISQKFYATATSASETHLGAQYKDEMANMALLGKWDNSALSNSVFDVKRTKLMEMTEISFIPVCTRRVFMKMYGDKENFQTYFWGDKDRDAYIDAIEDTLADYLPIGYKKDKEYRKESEQNNQNKNNEHE